MVVIFEVIFGGVDVLLGVGVVVVVFVFCGVISFVSCWWVIGMFW